MSNVKLTTSGLYVTGCFLADIPNIDHHFVLEEMNIKM